MHKSDYICPVCRKRLGETGWGYRCPAGHSFDRSAKGYTNFLLPAQTKGKIPGDNRQMVNARRDFLNLGLYRLLSDTLDSEILRWAGRQPDKTLRVLDAGCGEGYYTSRLEEALRAEGYDPRVLGFDISKFALMAACARSRRVQWAVASLFELPVEAGWADLAVNIFAPYSEEEFGRVLHQDGMLVMVFPGPRHLYGLKSFLYEEPYENEVKNYQLKGFSFTGRVTVGDSIRVVGAQNIQNLFSMTPYYWKTSLEAANRLKELTELETEIQFDLLFYRKKSSPGRGKGRQEGKR